MEFVKRLLKFVLFIPVLLLDWFQITFYIFAWLFTGIDYSERRSILDSYLDW